MKKGWWIVGLCGVVVIGLSTQVHPHRYREGRSQDPLLRVEVNKSSLARIMGEFRTGMSDMLFIKTERYLHSGVGYVPHLAEKLLTVEGTDEGVDAHLEEMVPGGGEPEEAAEEEEDHFHHEEEVETLVPAAEMDYRGWIGRMHREIKPWRDPTLEHKHTDGKELIPWFRMMTLSDPGYIRGYIVGAFWLRQHNPEAALEFIEEGLAENPDAFQLHLSKGNLLLRDARQISGGFALTGNTPEEMDILLQAKDSFQRATELMLKERPLLPEDGDIIDQPGWGFYLESDAMASATFYTLFEERFGDPEEAAYLRERFAELELLNDTQANP